MFGFLACMSECIIFYENYCPLYLKLLFKIRQIIPEILGIC